MNALLHLLYSSSFPPHLHLRIQIKLSMSPQSSSKEKKNYDEKITGFPLESARGNWNNETFYSLSNSFYDYGASTSHKFSTLFPEQINK